MSLVGIETGYPVKQARASQVDLAALKVALAKSFQGEVRFDEVSRALYSTDASVYQIKPLGVLVAKSRADVITVVKICAELRCPLTMRAGGTSQAGQAVGEGLQLDTSKYFNKLLEVNAEERWARVEPGIVLDELNAQLKQHNLRFAPDISTASRACIGGMIANNSSGARSVLYGKTIDHVLELEVAFADGTVALLGPNSPEPLSYTFEAQAYDAVRDLALMHKDEINARFPKVLRRVGGYNLDEFVDPKKPFNLAKMIVGSEGTLAVILEAKLNLVPLPKAKSVVAIHFHSLLESLEATPLILKHGPSAVEVMDKAILDNTKNSPALQAKRATFIEGDPASLLCVEFYADTAEELPPRMKALEADLRSHSYGYHFHQATTAAGQAAIWGLREAALGLSMSNKLEAKSASFVEDTAVAPEKLRDYIERFLAIVKRHGTTAGIYAHASVGCLHVRPVVNLKTAEGVAKFEAIANEVADLVLEFGGALSGEHGDGLVRSPFLRKMFGDVLYEAFRDIKHAFDPQGILNPGKIVDPPPLTQNLRYGAGYQTPNPPTYFDYSEYGGFGGAVDMCSGLGACRKKLDGTMCPSYMATHEEADSTRGRANVLRLAMVGQLGEAGLTQQGVKETLGLCLECRACKAECPVGVDMAKYKSEFLAAYYGQHGTPLQARLLGNVNQLARWGSLVPWLANASMDWMKSLAGVHPNRSLPPLAGTTWESAMGTKAATAVSGPLLFKDTFTNSFQPETGVAAAAVLSAAGLPATLAPNVCCGRPLISQGLLKQATSLAEQNTRKLFPAASRGQKLIFCEPSCLSAIKEDVPGLLRGDLRKQADVVADACLLFEDYLLREVTAGRAHLALRSGPQDILVHSHCHQKAMALGNVTTALLSRIPGANVMDSGAGCCGMAGSFGYDKDKFELSRQIAEQRLLPALRNCNSNTEVVAPGFSCRHQIKDFGDRNAVHPAVLLNSLLKDIP